MEEKGKKTQKKIIEAALFMAARPLSIDNLSEICNSGNFGAIRRDIEALEKEYSEKNGGLKIFRNSDGNYRMGVVPEIEGDVAMLAPLPDFSPAILKTLAFIAYEQPVTQSNMVKERGNRIYKYVKKLRNDEFISAEKKGRTKLLKTTPKFKDYFQIKDLSELKKIKAKMETYKEQKEKGKLGEVHFDLQKEREKKK